MQSIDRKVNMKFGNPVTTPWLKSRPESETVNKSAEKLRSVGQNVATVVHVTFSKGFLVR